MVAEVRSSVGHDRQMGDHHPTGPSNAGTVVLDIGPGAGAAVVRTTPDLCDHEIEIRPTGEPWRGRHVSVRPRAGARGVQFAAIFGGLLPGAYELRVLHHDADEPVLTVEVRDATVSQAEWPAA